MTGIGDFLKSLAGRHGRLDWPLRGVYFFFEAGENRQESGSGLRVVRVGTHALKDGSQTTLWDRLSQHQGTQASGGGNHRGSVFRAHVGAALIAREAWTGPAAQSWDRGRHAPRDLRLAELPLERVVSAHIRAMPFLWLEVDDPPGPSSRRGWIERNAIALLSNFLAPQAPLDPPGAAWLGRHAASESIRRSGLWNVNHVAEGYAPGFLEVLEGYVRE